MGARLGQHFLRDKNLASKIAEYATIFGSETVLEIGPGHGILTEQLAERAKNVIAVEKDRELARKLENRWSNVEIITGDALNIEWPKFDKIVSNLPYQISSPVMFKIFDQKWKSAVLMLQKEFAQRLIAKPGVKDYSHLTAACNYYCEAKILRIVPKGAFSPRPKVDSAVVKLSPIEKPFETDDFFWDTLNKLFQHKKKTIRAAVKSAKLYDHFQGNAVPLTLPLEMEKKRIFQCDLQDLRQIINILREHMH